jgi:hypothetical protein
MLNGDGVATGGGFNYWDLSYNGTGSTSVDSAPLTGGLGDLTDGVIAAVRWDLVEDVSGTGPYVGWSDKATPTPLVTFRFAGPVSLNSLTIYFDDSDGYGGVSPPLSVDIGPDGGPFANYPVFDPVGGVPFSQTFSGLGLAGQAVSVQFHNSGEWVFVSEVSFDGSTVPEPSTLWLGLGGLGLLWWRRKWTAGARTRSPSFAAECESGDGDSA